MDIYKKIQRCLKLAQRHFTFIFIGGLWPQLTHFERETRAESSGTYKGLEIVAVNHTSFVYIVNQPLRSVRLQRTVGSLTSIYYAGFRVRLRYMLR